MNNPIDNRLGMFNSKRVEILQTVKSRLLSQYIREGLVAEVLQEAVFYEFKRLSNGPDKARGHWRTIARRLSSAGESERVQILQELLSYFCDDIVGNFDGRVYWFAQGVLPPAMSFMLSPVRSVKMGVKAFSKLSGRVVVDGAVDEVKHHFRNSTVIVAPTHTSNLDSVVLGLALEKEGLPPVTYGAGKNLFTNPFLSFFMRNLGAYRVDRRLRFRLYKDVLKTYSSVLIEFGFHSLFFPGGTRCRSNVVESSLKLGLLGTAVSAYRQTLMGGDKRPVVIVPATINYRLVLEAESLIEDHLSADGKERYMVSDDEFSRVGRVVDFARKMVAMDAPMVLRLGRPLNVLGGEWDGRELADYFVGPDESITTDSEREKEYTRRVGDNLIRAFQKDTVLHDTNVVCRVMFEQACRVWGTSDIYQLMRFSPEDVSLPIAALNSKVAVFCENHKSNVFVRGREPSRFAQDGLKALQTYHQRDVIEVVGSRVVLKDWKLLYYYYNRTRGFEVLDEP